MGGSTLKKRKIFGVVTAEASSIEQRQILQGVITTGQENDVDIVVFTNIYNTYNTEAELYCENRIYELIQSAELDGLILIAESFIKPELLNEVVTKLCQRQDIPLIVISVELPQLMLPNATFVNADDANDMEEIITHLIEVHHYTRIDLLTGPRGNLASERRVAGYRRAMERHGFAFDKKRVHYGDFWMNSGEALAKRYVGGELPMPQAIACANDYMAFGVLDIFAQNGIRVPQDVAVTGYENVHERIYHTPILSTYQRDRFSLGKQAALLLLHQNGEKPKPPKGTWISGESCGCHVQVHEISGEMEELRTSRMYNQWSLFSTMEMKLTQCSTLEEFLDTLGNYQFMVRYAADIIVCLYDKWYRPEGGSIQERITIRSVVEWMRSRPTTSSLPCQLSDVLYGEAAGYYYTPLFFGERMFGMVVLRYGHPDCYDIIYRNWLKAVSNGLEFLRMKNDIEYLIQCQNLSEDYDTVTGLYQRDALMRELAATAVCSERNEEMLFLLVRENRMAASSRTQMETGNIRTAQAIAACMRSIQTDAREFIARLDSDTYLFAGIGNYSKETQEDLKDRLRTMLLHSSPCFEETSPDAYLLMTEVYPLQDLHPEEQLADLMERAEECIAEQAARSAEDLRFVKLRIQLYHQPQVQPTAEECCRKFCFSEGYFRARYKKLYEVSFHQDCIRAKISYAKYLLQTSAASVSAVAQQCGYHEDNYFLRQFRHETGKTPNQYRKKKA